MITSAGLNASKLEWIKVLTPSAVRSAVCVERSEVGPYSPSSTRQTEECVFNLGASGSSAQNPLIASPLTLTMAFKTPHGQPPTSLISYYSPPSTCSGHTAPWADQAHSGPLHLLLPPGSPGLAPPLPSGLCSNTGGRGSAVFKQMDGCILHKDDLELD